MPAAATPARRSSSTSSRSPPTVCVTMSAASIAGVGLLLYPLWVGGTALGTIIGDLLDPEAIGLDAAFPALFLALLVPYLRTRTALATALVSGAITLTLLPFAPPGVPIVAASLAALIGVRR